MGRILLLLTLVVQLPQGVGLQDFIIREAPRALPGLAREGYLQGLL